MAYRLEIEDGKGVFRFIANYKTAHAAWLRGWRGRKELDFRVFDSQGRRVVYSEDGLEQVGNQKPKEYLVDYPLCPMCRSTYEQQLASKDKRIKELEHRLHIIQRERGFELNEIADLKARIAMALDVATQADNDGCSGELPLLPYNINGEEVGCAFCAIMKALRGEKK